MMIGLFLLVGLLIGVVSGLLGVGGGVLLVPAVMFIMKDHDQLRAQGITLAVLVLPVVLPAVWGYYSHERFKEGDFTVVALLALGFAVGGYAGAQLVNHVPISVLRVLLGLILVYVAVRFLVASSNEFANALFGLIAMAFALIAYYALKALGRKYTPKPSLAATIQAMPATNASELDYYI